MSYLLRHDKCCHLEFGGWRSVDDIILKTGLSFDELCHIITTDTKGRYEFNYDRTKIRALYGHSVSVDMGYVCRMPPKILYHGSSKNAIPAILTEGLLSRSRNYVHLASDKDSALSTGKRHGTPVIIQINVMAMVENGYEFYNPTGNIWLVQAVPSQFIQSIVFFNR